MYVVAIAPDMVEDASDRFVGAIQCDGQSQNLEWIKWMGWWRFEGNAVFLCKPMTCLLYTSDAADE